MDKLIIILIGLLSIGAIDNATSSFLSGEKFYVDLEFEIEDAFQGKLSTHLQRLAVTRNNVTYETHVYDGPRGKGYIVKAKINRNGKTYLIEKHVGPETDRDIATTWREVL